MFYQNHSSLATERLKLENGVDFSFPLHLHSSFEFIVVTEGEMEVTVDKKSYVLHAVSEARCSTNEKSGLKQLSQGTFEETSFV